MLTGCVIYSPDVFSGNIEHIKMQKSQDREYFSLKRDARYFRDNGRSTKTPAKSQHRTSQLLSSHLPHFFFVIPFIDRYSILSLFSRCSLGSTGILCLTMLVEYVWRNRMTFLVTCRKFVWRDN